MVSMGSSFEEASPRDSLATSVGSPRVESHESDIILPQDSKNKNNVPLWISPTTTTAPDGTLSPPATPKEVMDPTLDQVVLPPVRNATPSPSPAEKPVLPSIKTWINVVQVRPGYAILASDPNYKYTPVPSAAWEAAKEATAAQDALVKAKARLERNKITIPASPKKVPVHGYNLKRSAQHEYYYAGARYASVNTPAQPTSTRTASGASRRKVSVHSTAEASASTPRAGHRRKISQVDDGEHDDQPAPRRRNTNPNRPAKPQHFSEIYETHKHFLPHLNPEEACGTYRPGALKDRLRISDNITAGSPSPPTLNRSNLSQDPDVQLVHPWEVELAEELRMKDLNQYYVNKLRIFKRLYERRAERRGFTKTHAQSAGTVDVNKMSKLWEAYNRIGWFEIPLQSIVDERLAKLTPDEADAARLVVF
jgi:SWIRM domain